MGNPEQDATQEWLDEAQDTFWIDLEAEASARTERRNRPRRRMKVDGAGLKTVALNRRFNCEDAGN